MHDETLPGIPIVELVGDCRLLIENHKSVRRFDSELITVCLKYGLLCVSGSQLQLCKMSDTQLVITGRIEQLSIVKGDSR